MDASLTEYFFKTVVHHWRVFLNRSAGLIFPSYYDKVVPLKQTFQSQDIIADTAFQNLIYYNIYLYPMTAFGAISTVLWKIANFNLSTWHMLMIVAFYGTYVIFEPIRLYLGYFGNLKERVPYLCGCLLFSMWQLGSTSYVIALQPLTGKGFTTPYELGTSLVILMLLIPQLFLGYASAQRIMLSQTVGFYTRFKNEF